MSDLATVHVGIIMDGNGRWATMRGRSRFHGYPAGARAVRKVVRVAPDFGIRTLTLYAFSADNWQRPASEVRLLFRLFERYLRREKQECVSNDVRLEVIGRRDRLSPTLLAAVDEAEMATLQGEKLLLRLAVDYSGRQAILDAARRYLAATVNSAVPRASSGQDLWLTEDRVADFGRTVSDQRSRHTPVGGVDLIIRTGGEQRLSDFLLWEAAYAELYFTDVMWPDFTPDTLETAMHAFWARERRFGKAPTAAASLLPSAVLTPAASPQ